MKMKCNHDRLKRKISECTLLERYHENEMQPIEAMIPLTWNGRIREVGENALPHVTHVWKNCENALTSLKREGIKGTVNWMKVKV